MAIALVSAAERPDLIEAAEHMFAGIWPVWLRTKALVSFWDDIYGPILRPYQTFAIDDVTGDVVACANSIPFLRPEALPDTGWDWVMEQGALAARNNTPVDALSALAVSIPPAYRGTGLASCMLEAMKPPARRAGLKSMVAPVRPTHKSLYPLQNFATYCSWRRDDKLPFDPWLRTHEKLGASVIGPAASSMIVTAAIAQWENWTGLRLPASGSFALERALAPLEVDHATGMATYTEPNLWMEHPL
jgi:GNAT superfamily N-acetyltransferase